MAKTTLNPMFTSYTGRMGRIVHYNLFGRQYCRMHVIPKNPRTECQQAVRRTFSEAVHSWRNLSSEEKNEYSRRARYRPFSGYNLYVGRYMKLHMPVYSQTGYDKELPAGMPVICRYSHKGTAGGHHLTAPFQLLYSTHTGPAQAGCTHGPCT